MNYNEFANRIKEKYPEYNDMDNKELATKMVQKYPDDYSDVTFDEPKIDNVQVNEDGSLKQPLQGSVKKFDLRPSALADEAAKRIVAVPIAGYNAIKNKSFKGAYSQALDSLENAKHKVYDLNPELEKIDKRTDALLDVGSMFMLPGANVFKGAGLGARAGNAALTGGYQGGLIGGIESLRNEGDLKGVIPGAALGAGLGGGLSAGGNTLGKVLPWIGERAGVAFGGISPETLRQSIKPNSIALDLSPDAAQRLLTNTTERVRNAYNNLLNRRGEAVENAAKSLKNLDARSYIGDIENDIKKVFDQYQGDKINPARNMTGRLEQDLKDLVRSASPVIDIDTELIPTYTGNKNQYNREIRNLYKQNVKGKTILHPEQGEIYFPKNGVGETINKSGNDYEQLSLLPQIDEITQKAKFQNIEGLIPGHKNRMQAKDFDVLRGRANLGEKTIDTDIKIANTPQGKMFYLNEKPLRSQDFIPNMEPGLEANNIINDNDAYFNSISPIDLQKIKEQVGKMVNWSDETARNYKNPILEQIYGRLNNRLSSLSPEMEAANRAYADIAQFKKNEGLRSVLRNGDSIDSASTTLRNYNSTVSKGNTNRNIQDLENVLVQNGEKPFINTIDDINAAMDLANSRTTGRNFLGATDLMKSLLITPTLKGIRALNRNPQLPILYEQLGRQIPTKLIPMLYGVTRPFDD